MFRIVNERLAWWSVTFPGVAEDGEVVENRIELRFRILDEDEFPEFMVKLTDTAALANPAVADAAASGEAPEAPSVLAARLLAPIVRDWRGVASENGEALPYSEETFRLLLRQPGVSGAVGRAYINCRNATPDIRAGN